MKRSCFCTSAAVIVAVVLGLAGNGFAELLNSRLEAPVIESVGIFSYNAATNKLTVDPGQSYAWSLTTQEGDETLYFENYNAPIVLEVKIDANGELIDDMSETPDLIISGDITIPGLGSYSGQLVTAKAIDFGFEDGGEGTTDMIDFRFGVIGGALSFLFEGKDLGLSMTFEPAFQNPRPFQGSFAFNFNGFFSYGKFGSIKPSPLACESGNGLAVSLRLGDSDFFQPDATGVVVPVISSDIPVTFKLDINNCDENKAYRVGRARRNGCWFGRPRNPDGTKVVLDPFNSFTVDTNNYNPRFLKLESSDLCKRKVKAATTLDLSFNVLMREDLDRTQFKELSAPVFAKCAGISIKKEVSKDGGNNYRNADNPCGAPDEVLNPKKASAFFYRYIISNPCAAALQNIHISDPELSIEYDVPGILAAGTDIIIIDYSTIPALIQPPDQVCELGDIATKEGCGVNNVTVQYDESPVTVTANAVPEGLSPAYQPLVTVTDQDTACLKCL